MKPRLVSKSKLNRKYIGEVIENENLIVHLDETVCLRLLSHDAFRSGTIDQALMNKEQILLL
jgi:hypothetical protein